MHVPFINTSLETEPPIYKGQGQKAQITISVATGIRQFVLTGLHKIMPVMTFKLTLQREPLRFCRCI